MTLPLGGAGQDVGVRLYKKLEATDVDSCRFLLCVFEGLSQREEVKLIQAAAMAGEVPGSPSLPFGICFP